MMKYDEIKNIIKNASFPGIRVNQIYRSFINNITNRDYKYYNMINVIADNERSINSIYIRVSEDKNRIIDFLFSENISFSFTYSTEKIFLILFTDKDECQVIVVNSASEFPNYNEYEKKRMDYQKIMDSI